MASGAAPTGPGPEPPTEVARRPRRHDDRPERPPSEGVPRWMSSRWVSMAASAMECVTGAVGVGVFHDDGPRLHSPTLRPRGGARVAGLCDGRICVVTGAGRGIGREHALALARAGATVVVNDRGGEVDGSGASSDPAQQVVDEISAAGGTAIANTDDVAD